MKMKMTEIMRIASVLLAVLLILPLSSCFDPNYKWDLPEREPVVFPPLLDLPDVTTSGQVVYDTPDDGGVILRLSDDGEYYIAVGCRDKTLTSITIPNKYNGLYVTEIADYAFSNMKNLTYVSIPDSVLYVGYKAFDGCPSISYTDNEITGAKYLGNITHPYRVLIGIDKRPESFSVNNVTVVIADGAFENCTKLQAVSMSSRVRTVGDYAFRGCTALKEVIFQGDVEYIGEQAFASCTKLGKMNLPAGVKTLGAGAFEGCTSLWTASTGNGVRVIEANTFAGCTSLKSMTLGAGVNHIKETAFRGCVSLPEIILPPTAQYVDASAFLDCPALEYAEYEGGKYLPSADNEYFLLYDVTDYEVTNLPLHYETTGVAYGLFGSLEKLTGISIEENYGMGKSIYVANNCIYRTNFQGIANRLVMGMNRSRPFSSSTELTICDYAFYGCDLTYMEKLGRYVKEIGDYAFANCRGADSIRFFSAVESIGEGAFMNFDSLEYIYFSGVKVKSIGDRAFYGCDNLSDELRLPEGLTELGASAFEACPSLLSVTLPESLETVGNRAFADCSSLREITVGSGIKRVGADMVVNTAAAIQYMGDREAWLAVINRDAMKGIEPYTVICRDGYVKYE